MDRWNRKKGILKLDTVQNMMIIKWLMWSTEQKRTDSVFWIETIWLLLLSFLFSKENPELSNFVITFV